MEKNQKNNVIVVRVAELVRLLIKKLWIMVLAGVIFAAAGYGYATVTAPTPMYSATTKLYVTGVEAAVPSTPGLNLGQQVLGSYIEILKSRPVLEKVIENLNLNMSYLDLKNCISQNIPEGTCMLEINVIFPDPDWAKKVADELVKVSAERALEVMGCTTPTVYEEAYVPTEAYNIDYLYNLKFLALGAFAGVALASFAVLVSYFANTKFNNPNKVTDKIHLKTLGVIPDGSSKNAAYENAAYQNFFAQLYFEKPEAKIVDFVSATSKENKYEFLEKAAEDLKKAGKRVLLLDTNLSNPKWGLGGKAEGTKKGLEAYLSGKAKLEEVVVNKEGVDYIYSTEAVVNAVELLAGETFHGLLKELKEVYDYVLVDTAPMDYVPDALCTAKTADAVVLVLSGKFSRIRQAREMIQTMEEREVSILGVVLKDMNIRKGGKYFCKEFGKYFGVYKK